MMEHVLVNKISEIALHKNIYYICSAGGLLSIVKTLLWFEQTDNLGEEKKLRIFIL